MPLRWLIIIQALCVLGALPGCVTYWQGKEMRADIAALQGQVEQLTDDQRTSRERFQAELETLKAKIDKASQRLNSAVDNLQTNTADSGLVIEDLQRELAMLKGDMAVLEHKRKAQTDGAESAFGVPTVGPQLPNDPVELYRYGYEQKQAEDCPSALVAFFKLARDFPDYDRTDNGLALAAECQFAEQDYKGSMRTLKSLLDKYPKGDKADDALVLMHDNLMAVKKCKQALAFLESMVDGHPRSNRIKEAKAKLKKTRKKCK